MASEMFVLIIDFFFFLFEAVPDFCAGDCRFQFVTEFLEAFESFRGKAESYILSSFVKIIRITAEDSFHVVRYSSSSLFFSSTN